MSASICTSKLNEERMREHTQVSENGEYTSTLVLIVINQPKIEYHKHNNNNS